MHQHDVAAMTRALSNRPSRRDILRGLAAAGLGLVTARFAGDARAKKKRKKLKRNSFGCVDVGKACRGNDANCCSGICEGKKPKKGKKDKSTCVAHNVLDCQAGWDGCLESGVSCGTDGTCYQTTGKANFCAASDGDCFACTKDVDCEAAFGPGAACTPCDGACAETGGLVCRAAN